MQIISAGITDRGQVRRNNEDSFVQDDARGLYAVADGIGGLDAGEVASKTTVETLAEQIGMPGRGGDSTPPRGTPRNEAPELAALRSAVALANQRVHAAAGGGDASHGGMGSTVTALLLANERAFLAHVGDSRAYRLRGKTLEQITSDHTVAEEHVRAGLISRKEIKRSPYNNVLTRAVGIAPDVSVDLSSVPVRQGDRFLLCTDGLTDLVSDAEIKAVLGTMAPAAAARELVRLANERGGRDNITTVVVEAAAGKARR